MSRIKHEKTLATVAGNKFLMLTMLFIYDGSEPKLLLVGSERPSDDDLAVGLNRENYHKFKKLIAEADLLYTQARDCPNLMPTDRFANSMTLKFVVGFLKINDFVIFIELSFDRQLKATFQISLDDSESGKFIELRASSKEFDAIKQWIQDTDSKLEELFETQLLEKSFLLTAE